jgi:hypothetical protein
MWVRNPGIIFYSNMEWVIQWNKFCWQFSRKISESKRFIQNGLWNVIFSISFNYNFSLTWTFSTALHFFSVLRKWRTCETSKEQRSVLQVVPLCTNQQTWRKLYTEAICKKEIQILNGKQGSVYIPNNIVARKILTEFNATPSTKWIFNREDTFIRKDERIFALFWSIY